MVRSTARAADAAKNVFLRKRVVGSGWRARTASTAVAVDALAAKNAFLSKGVGLWGHACWGSEGKKGRKEEESACARNETSFQARSDRGNKGKKEGTKEGRNEGRKGRKGRRRGRKGGEEDKGGRKRKRGRNVT